MSDERTKKALLGRIRCYTSSGKALGDGGSNVSQFTEAQAIPPFTWLRKRLAR
jgi:hypothetical protein